MYSKVHEAGYRGFMEGLMSETMCELEHTIRIPDGAPYYEMIIALIDKNSE